MSKAVIVLAGGLSKRFGENKCLKELAGKPLILHVLSRVRNVADEHVIVVGSEAQLDFLSRLPGFSARVVIDKYEGQGPLIGALTGFESVQSEIALLLPCDAAFVSSEIAALLLDLCLDRNAALPRWPNGYVEPLQAAYNVECAIDAAKKALKDGKYDMLAMISHLHRIRYVSTMALMQYDEKLATFSNINTIQDWKKAELSLRKGRCTGEHY